MVSEKEAQELIDAVDKAFPQKKAYFHKVFVESLTKGYIKINDVNERKVLIHNYSTFAHYYNMNARAELSGKLRVSFNKWLGEIERACMNYPIQGTAAEMTKEAAYEIDKYIVENGFHILRDVMIVNQVHDEIVLEVEESLVDVVSAKAVEIMKTVGNKYAPSVPFPVDPKIDKIWLK